MPESFESILTVGGKMNTLGRADEVVRVVLDDQSRLDELFKCIFHDDAWVRMRAIDSVEKVCREHPEWMLSYANRLLNEVAVIDQPSIQWHLAELFAQIELTSEQRRRAIEFMKHNIASVDADWIVASNTMQTLSDYVNAGYLPAAELTPLLHIQQNHHSNAVVKRATKILENVSA